MCGGINTWYHGIFQHNIRQLFCDPYPQIRNRAINANAVKIQIQNGLNNFYLFFLIDHLPPPCLERGRAGETDLFLSWI